MCIECRQTPCASRCPNAKEPEIIGWCCVCGDQIHEDEDHYEPYGDLVCCGCDSDYMHQFKKEGALC